MHEYKKFISSDTTAVIYLKSVAYKRVTMFDIDSKNVETGGILIGRYSSSLNDVYINEMMGAPSDSNAGFSWFVRGIKGLGEYLKKKWSQTEEYYLGEWHYHPANVPYPSLQDVSQLRRISTDERFKCKEPILIVVSKNNEGYNVSVSLLIGSKICRFYEDVA